MSLPEFSIKRPVTVLMAVMICLLLGAISFVEIPVDLMPEIDSPTLSITTDYEGVAPEEIETLISRPMEQIVSSAPGVERVSSTSSEGRSAVRVEFAYGMDIEVAADEVRSRLDRGRRALPDDVDPPTIFKFDVTQFRSCSSPWPPPRWTPRSCAHSSRNRFCTGSNASRAWARCASAAVCAAKFTSI